MILKYIAKLRITQYTI